MKITELKLNPTNPRVIKDEKFKQLVKSIQDFPEMLIKRPIVCVTDTDGTMYPLGGNMRLKALQELKYKEIPNEWVMNADDWTEDQRKEFVIKDNVAFGEWNWDMLNADWDVDTLEDWGVEMQNEDFNVQDYSDKNKEIDTDDFSDKMDMRFEFTSEEYQYILSELSKINASKENALLTLLNYGA